MASNNPTPPQTKTQEILSQVHQITDIAANAVLQAQQAGVGESGESKKNMALKLVHIGLQTAGIFVPGVAAASNAEAQLEPTFAPLFTYFVNIFRSHGHPAFVQPQAPAAPPATS